MDLLKSAKKLPLSSGVYIFVDKRGKFLYIGRATSLRRRVLNYFRKDLDSRLAEMVSLANRLKHYKTDTVLEAVILEANLIKKYWPKYNVKDKDNRSFVYIVMSQGEYSRPLIIRERELRKFPKAAKVFGPYQSAKTVADILHIIRKIFPYSTCRPNSGKACFEYQIGLCPGACVSKISKKDYQNNINNIVLFLSGKKQRLLKKLSAEDDFKARRLKCLQDVILISKEEFPALVSQFNRIEGYDISHLSGKETYGSMVVFINGEVDKAQYRLFRIKQAPANDDLRALEEMLSRRFRHPEWRLPNLVLIDGGKPQIDFVYKLFKSRQITIPLIGISKLQNDRLIFPLKTKKSIKDLAESMKNIFLQVRDEAHRFALKAHRHRRGAGLRNQIRF